MIRLFFLVFLFAVPLQAQEQFETSEGPVVVEPVLSGLDEPWAVAFLPDGGLLVTERDGQLIHVATGRAPTRLSGVPKVVAQRQGGLLDVVVARDFSSTNTIFLTYSEPREGGSGTALATAQLDVSTSQLTNLTVIFRQRHASRSSHHYGSRVVEAEDGTLFLTVGDRGARAEAQDLTRHNGKVVRVTRSGAVPADNPFATGGGLPEIWSYGHRNPQGAALDGRGRLWTVEHGAQGGDEINRPAKGRNYGWPVISYGRHYSGAKIGEGTEKAGMEQPEYFWDPSIAPSGMMIYSGRLWPDWQGDIFVGSLKFNYLSRLDPETKREEELFRDVFFRIRDVREAPDGTIWFLSAVDGVLYRMRPA